MAHMEYRLGKDQLGRWGQLPITAYHVAYPQWDAHYRVEVGGVRGLGPTLELAMEDLREELRHRSHRASQELRASEALLESVKELERVYD